jgi:hypothetical protein
MSLGRVAATLALLLVSAATAAGQTDPPTLPSRAIEWRGVMPDGSVSPAERLSALQRWTQEYGEWKAWYARWRNRSEPGWLSSRARRQPPVPPEWLPAACSVQLEEEGPLVDACGAWREWSQPNDAADVMARQVAQARTNSEAPRKTLWWERVHVDGLWPMTRTGTSAFGVVGMHTTLHLTDRFQIFLAPGVILMRLPSIGAAPTWSAATDWGFSYSLFDLRLPGVGRPSTLHLNIARVWLLGSEKLPVSSDLYLAGLSLTFKQR